MTNWLRSLSIGQRRLVFFLGFGGGVLLLVAVTSFLVLRALNTRDQAVALAEGVTVREFAVLPDDDAYPASVAVGPDGVVYTGSYVTGAVWAIDDAGTVTELPNTRDAIGSVTGLAVAPDGTLYVVDRLSADPRTVGGVVWRLAPGGIIGRFAAPDDGGGFLAPDDIALDADGFVYVSDRGRQQVWRFNSDGGDSQAWWRSPAVPNADSYAPTGLAYDPIHDAIIITDPEVNAIYRVAVADGNTETLYLHGDRPYQPGFDGVTVTPDGTLYVAALGQNGIARLREGELEYIAGLFRGASDVAHDGNDRLYVTNFDQFSLLVSVVSPRLPFALDVITLD